jgi:hypothetical protein
MRTQFITDTTGKTLSVILPIKDYQKMIDDLEELEDIKAYDRAKARKSEPVPFKQAVKELELLRNGSI